MDSGGQSDPADSLRPLIELDTDLDEVGRFGKRTLRVTSDRVLVLDSAGAVVFQVPLGEVVSARNEPLVGGGRMELRTRGGELLPIISYTATLAERFSEIARGIEQLAKGEPLFIKTSWEKTRCPKCGQLLPEKDGVCPSCVNRGKTFLRIARYLLPYRKLAIAMVCLSFCTTILNLIPPIIQGRLIENVITKQTNLQMLWQLLGVWLGVVVMSSLVNIARDQINARLSAHIAADLRSSVYKAIEYLQLTFFDKKQVGAIASRVTSDTDRVWGFLVEGVPYFLLNGLMFFGVVGFMIYVNPLMAVCMLVPVPIVITIAVRFWKPMSAMFHRVGQKWARFHTHLNESLSGIRVVKAFGNESHEFTKFQDRNHELRNAGMRADSRWYAIFGGMLFFTSSGTLIGWGVGGYLVVHHQLTIAQFWMMLSYLGLIYGPIAWFAAVNNWFSRAMAGAERIFEVIDMDAEEYRLGEPMIPITGEITFDNVRFGYDKSNPVLKDISFTAKAGEMIGLVGKSGSGKTTTINLIARFYEPDAGTIRIDGRDYREHPLQGLRSQIGIVLQEPFLFNGTILENISYGKPDATMDEVIAAARAANAHSFILSKPMGYDTIVGERGSKLSGGERQRVSIARAILHNPRILILDEATSSVDVETEKQIQEAIQHLVSGRTTFAIAHRLSTLRNADRLIVLERGKIVEIGSHEELMSKKGVFFGLVQTQSAINEILGLAYTEGDEPAKTEEVDWA